MSRLGLLAAGVVFTVVIDVLASAAVLVTANMSVLTTSFLLVMVVVAVVTGGVGLLMRVTGKDRLGTGVVIGAACAVPVGFTLSLLWVVLLVIADAAFCTPSSTYWCFD